MLFLPPAFAQSRDYSRSKDRERERERERVCVRACLLVLAYECVVCWCEPLAEFVASYGVSICSQPSYTVLPVIAMLAWPKCWSSLRTDALTFSATCVCWSPVRR